MRLQLFACLVVLTALISASPTPDTSATISPLHQLVRQKGDACTLPTPGSSCSGAALRDVIIEFPTSVSASNMSLMKEAVTGSGGKITYDYNALGFAGYIPQQTLNLMQMYGKSFGMQVFDNECISIAPCGSGAC